MNTVCIIDNYDSFTYNLFHLVKSVTKLPVDIFKNDQILLEDIIKYNYIIISPGPDLPNNAGITLDIIKKYADTKNILGVCLGHQAIGQTFGATLKQLPLVCHGKKTTITLSDKAGTLFADLSLHLEVGRYHSWVIEKNNLPDNLLITSFDENGEIMSIQLKDKNVFGVQFHPESIMTTSGKKIIENFLNC